ncbi:hypothetical protein LG634_33055 [Streptomyces bambusae]|uniref:hypothetical protein n=1 Tax=Streptomyces bambusae TaxID=1550616 RepID=UPI001CFF6E17|nr:hypothetical protein [Streptomyces bambusae]MCB5169623.1 hypothetical protein [Streptomyces bambusae]
MRMLTGPAIAALVLTAGAGTALAVQTGTGPTAASAAESREMLRIADTYLAHRAAAVTAEGSRVPADVLTAPLADTLRGEFDALAARGRSLHGIGAGYSRAETDPATGTPEVSGTTATLELEELTRLFHEVSGPGAPPYEAYALTHTLTFHRAANGHWLLSAARPHIGPADLPPTTHFRKG